MMKVKGAGLFGTMKIENMEAMAEKGMTRQQIGAYYGVTGQRIGQLIKEHPELEEAFDRGLSKGIEKVTNKLWELIEEKNIVAILFFLKCHGKWIEQQYVKEKEVDDSPRVTIFLPENNRDIIQGEVITDEQSFY